MGPTYITISATVSGSTINYGLEYNYNQTEYGSCSSRTMRVYLERIVDGDVVSIEGETLFSGLFPTTGNLSGNFQNVPNGTYRIFAVLYCGPNPAIHVSSGQYTVSAGGGGGTPTPPSGNPSPGTGGTTNPNINTPEFCVGTNEVNLSFSRLNILFNRAGNTPNTRISGPSNPSVAPSLMGLSLLPSNVVTPGKLRQNAISEFRGSCVMGNASEYRVYWGLAGTFPVSGIDNTFDRVYNLIWLHLPSGNITTNSPWGNSSIAGTIFTETVNPLNATPISNQGIYSSRIVRNGSTIITASRASNSTGRTTQNYSIGTINRGDTIQFIARYFAEPVGQAAGDTFLMHHSVTMSSATIASASLTAGNRAPQIVFEFLKLGPPIVNPTINWTSNAQSGQSGTLTINGVSPTVSRSVTSGQAFSGTSTGNHTQSITCSFQSNTGAAQLLVSRSSPSFLSLYTYNGPGGFASFAFTPEQGASYQITGRALSGGGSGT